MRNWRRGCCAIVDQLRILLNKLILGLYLGLKSLITWRVLTLSRGCCRLLLRLLSSLLLCLLELRGLG